MENQTITITFCDQAENHVGMEKLGSYAKTGFRMRDLLATEKWFNKKGIVTELHDLDYQIESRDVKRGEEACILIIRNGVDCLLGDSNCDMLFDELLSLKWDQKALMRGKVVNKRARHNICFSNYSSEPDYPNGKGRVISFDRVPFLNALMGRIPDFIGEAGSDLVAEGNYYYDTTKCGIGYHGDSERRKVLGIRLGATMPLVYQWYINSERVGEKMEFELNHGDIYVMTEKATGNDWKKRSEYTLRHAAGCNKYTK